MLLTYFREIALILPVCEYFLQTISARKRSLEPVQSHEFPTHNSPCLFKGSLNLFLLSKKRGKPKDRDCRVKGWGGERGMGEGGEEGRASSSVPSSVSLPQTEYTLISSLNLPEKFQHPKKKNTDYRRPYANRIHAAQTKI